MNRKDRLGRLAERAKDSRVLMVPELQDDLRFVLDELGRFDGLRDEIRELRTKLELVQYQLRTMRETVNGN